MQTERRFHEYFVDPETVRKIQSTNEVHRYLNNEDRPPKMKHLSLKYKTKDSVDQKMMITLPSTPFSVPSYWIIHMVPRSNSLRVDRDPSPRIHRKTSDQNTACPKVDNKIVENMEAGSYFASQMKTLRARDANEKKSKSNFNQREGGNHGTIGREEETVYAIPKKVPEPGNILRMKVQELLGTVISSPKKTQDNSQTLGMDVDKTKQQSKTNENDSLAAVHRQNFHTTESNSGSLNLKTRKPVTRSSSGKKPQAQKSVQIKQSPLCQSKQAHLDENAFSFVETWSKRTNTDVSPGFKTFKRKEREEIESRPVKTSAMEVVHKDKSRKANDGRKTKASTTDTSLNVNRKRDSEVVKQNTGSGLAAELHSSQNAKSVKYVHAESKRNGEEGMSSDLGRQNKPPRQDPSPPIHRKTSDQSLHDLSDDNSTGVTGAEQLELLNKRWRPLTRKLKIPAAIISPYRLFALIRLVVLGLFLHWRITHPNEDAIWLWYMSIVCECWFAFSWILDQLPKLAPVNRATDLGVLKEKFETPCPQNPSGKSDLPGVDVFVSTADPEKEPPLVTANTILSILAADYPVNKLACYVSDDGGALLTFEAMAEAASFANLWVPFCRKHKIEPRNPESYFSLKKDPFKNKGVRQDFVKDRRRVKREYDEFKVRVNGLPDSIRRRSDAYNAREEIKAMKLLKETANDELLQPVKIPKATWMADATHWPGTWMIPSPEHSRGDHAGIIQVMLKPPSDDPLHGTDDEANPLDFTEVDIRLPLLVYVSREKRPGYDHNKKAGAMNALVRASAIMSNGPFMLNLDCDHYIYNSEAIREGMCFMMDRGGDRICYVQFPQRFEGIDPSDRYANHNTVFFDGNMRALDGLQGPVYVGTGTLFRRVALYGFDPPRSKDYQTGWNCCFGKRKKSSVASAPDDNRALRRGDSDDDEEKVDLYREPKRYGNSSMFIETIETADFQGKPLADHPGVRNGRPPGALMLPRELLDASSVAEAISVISCWYEDKTEWGNRVGWIYGSVTEDVLTGYRMHNRGWRSIYCVTKRDAFRGTAPINLTDRLHQVLRWATGSVEIFFSKNNAFLASSKMKFLQRVAYLNVGIYPFTSIFLIVYCFLPDLSLFTGQFIVQSLDVTFLIYLLGITISLCMLAILEIKWSGVNLEEWWRNEQFWLIGCTSAHLAAVLQGLLKVVAGIEISFTLTSKSGGDENDDEFADLYIIKWSSLMIPPIVIIMVNLIAIAVGVCRTIYSQIPQWSRLLGGVFFSFWVLAHLYPFAKGLMGRRRRTPTIVFVWAGLIAITILLLVVAIHPPDGANEIGGSF